MEVNEAHGLKDKIENQLRFSCQKGNELEVSLQNKNEEICSLALKISKLEIKSKSDDESLKSKTESLSQSENNLSAAQAKIKRLNAVISCSQIQVSAEKDALTQQLEALKEKNERISNFIQMIREQSCSLMPTDGEKNISNTSGPNTSETGTPTASTSIVNISYSGAQGPTYKSSTPVGGDSKKSPPFLGNLSANEKENLEIPKARRPRLEGEGPKGLLKLVLWGSSHLTEYLGLPTVAHKGIQFAEVLNNSKRGKNSFRNSQNCFHPLC